MTGFAKAPTPVLEQVRRNLLAGLDRVAKSLGDDTFNLCGPKGAAPPAQAGHLTLALLAGVDAELETRTDRSTA